MRLKEAKKKTLEIRNFRITDAPPTSCEEFEIVRIDDDQSKLNLHRIPDCSLFMSSGLHKKEFGFVDSWDKLKIKTRVLGIVGDVCFDGIDWNEYASPVIGGGYVINKSDIVKAYKESVKCKT